MSHSTEGKPGAPAETTLELVDSSEPLLEQLLASQSKAVKWRHETDAGYTVELSSGRPETLRLREPGGKLCATLHLGRDGVRLEVQATELHASASERVRIESNTVEIAARETLAMHSGGAIHQRAEGPHHSTAFEHRVEATHGEVQLRANDDVALDGERIRLNSPPVTTPPHLRRPPPEPED